MSKFNINGYPWAGNLFATDVKDCKTAQEVMIKAKLNFAVKKCELVAKMPFSLGFNANNEIDETTSFSRNGHIYRDCPNAYATYRTDLNIPLGLVKSKYEVVQNTAAFNFFNDAIGPDKAIWQTAGSFGYGERVFVSAKLPDYIKVNNEYIETYLVFTNSHDGSSGVTILFTPIRIVCINSLNAALKNTDSFIRIRHTQSVHGKILSAPEILGITKQQSIVAQELYNHLTTIKLDDNQVQKYLAGIHLTDEEYNKVVDYDPVNGFKKLFYKDYTTLEKTNISVRKANILSSTFEYYMDGIGQKEIAGTAWGAYNAVTGFYSNVANLEREKRMDSLLYGNANKNMNKALNAAIRIAAA